MTRILAILAILSALLPSVGLAATAAKPAPIDLSRVRCEDKEMGKLIVDQISKMRFTGTTQTVSSYMGNNSNLTATTVSASRNKLVCRVTVNFNFHSSGEPLRGTFTIRQFGNGKLTSEFAPGY